MTPTTTFASKLAGLPGSVLLLPLLVAIFATLEPNLLSLTNIRNLGVQSALLLMVALPMTLVILSEGLDLSAGALLSLSAVAIGLCLLSGAGIWVAVAVALAIGLAFGLANGLLIGAIGLPAFVVTLGTLGLAQGTALVLSSGNVVAGFQNPISDVYRSQFAGIPMPIIVAAALYAVFHILLYRTAFGGFVFAIGGNKEALRLAGLRARAIHVAVYVIASVTVALSAFLLIGRMNSAHPQGTLGIEFDAIAAVILGGTSFERGRGWLFGTVLGVATISVLRNGLNLLAISSSLQVIAVGVVMILAMLMDRKRNEH